MLFQHGDKPSTKIDLLLISSFLFPFRLNSVPTLHPHPTIQLHLIPNLITIHPPNNSTPPNPQSDHPPPPPNNSTLPNPQSDHPPPPPNNTTPPNPQSDHPPPPPNNSTPPNPQSDRPPPPPNNTTPPNPQSDHHPPTQQFNST